MTEEEVKVRTRFAPSPTGYLHIGSLRTALFSYLFARRNQGSFILRVEDTDQARFVEGAIEHIAELLQKMGLKYDEGVFFENDKLVSKGNYGPYLQSQRKAIYKEYAEKLVASKKAYYCFCDEKRLQELRKEQEALKQSPRYDRKCRFLLEPEIKEKLAAGTPYVIRQAIPEEGQTVVKDLVYKDIVWDNKTLDDQVLLKSDGFPTYHLAVVVDDHLMQITHIIRGEEWLPSAPKHALLFQAFEWPVPAFAHLPLLLNKDRSKLSKRQGDVGVEDYLKKGYLKEAIINFVALLGWNPKTDQEVFSLQELEEQFDLSKVNKASAVFDVEKLDWINGLYIRKKDLTELTDLCVPFLIESGLISVEGNGYKTKAGHLVFRDYLEEVIKLEQERLKKLSEIGERVTYFFEEPEYLPQIVIWKKSNLTETRDSLSKLLNFLKALEDNAFRSAQTLEEKVKAWIVEQKIDNGSILWPMRVALSGKEASPGPFEIAAALHKGYGKDEITKRIEIALKRLE